MSRLLPRALCSGVNPSICPARPAGEGLPALGPRSLPEQVSKPPGTSLPPCKLPSRSEAAPNPDGGGEGARHKAGTRVASAVTIYSVNFHQCLCPQKPPVAEAGAWSRSRLCARLGVMPAAAGLRVPWGPLPTHMSFCLLVGPDGLILLLSTAAQTGPGPLLCTNGFWHYCCFLGRSTRFVPNAVRGCLPLFVLCLFVA